MKAVAQTLSIFPGTAVDQGCGFRASDVDLEGSMRDLEANLLVLCGEDQQPIVLVSIDTLYPGEQLTAAIRNGAQSLPHERVLIAATHTHAAPMTDGTKPPLGETDQDHMIAITQRLEGAVNHLLARVEDAPRTQMNCGSGVADHSINRRGRQGYVVGRRPRLSHIAAIPNPGGSRDETITLFTLTDASGSPVAVVWNYACHPVAQPSPEQYSAQFPGRVRERVRAWFGNPGLPVLYFQGFSGDTRPSASVRESTIVERIRNAGRRTSFDRMSPDVYTRWCASLGDRVIEILQGARPVGADTISTSATQEKGANFTAGQSQPVPFQALAFGEDLTILAVGAEPVSAYAHWARSTVDSDFVMCVGCIEQTYGYLPTTEICREGGYEGGDFCSLFGLGEIAPRIDPTARAAIRRVLDQLDSARSNAR